MILLEITEVKECMSKLLLSNIFDPFLFIEGEITTFNTFSMDGFLKQEFFSEEERALLDGRRYSLWRDLREYCFSLMKGKKTPLSFKLIFGLSDTNIAKLLTQQQLSFTPADVQGLYLNFKYDGQHLTCVTGTSMHLFTLDKSLEQAWDQMVEKFFLQKQIAFDKK